MADPTDPPGVAGDTGPVDEVGFDLGADDVVPGLLDAWAGRTRPGSDGSGTNELTSSFSPDEPPLTAVLARVAAGLGREAALDRFLAGEGHPSGAVKVLIADEPLDPLPSPEGLLLSGTGFLDVEAVSDDTAVAEIPGWPRLVPASVEASRTRGTPQLDGGSGWGSTQRPASVARFRLVGIGLVVILVLVAFTCLLLHGA